MATVSPVDQAEIEADGKPVTVNVTIDQIVAMNMRYWRREAEMTQEELGELLGWSAANVSAAERSADEGRDRRRFDAGTLTSLSLALGIPLVALFFPPVDDGPEKRYVFPALPGNRDGDTELDMADLLEFVVMPDSDDDSELVDAYRRRFTAVVSDYLDAKWAREAARWLKVTESGEQRAARAAHLRNRRAELLRTAVELGDLADAIDPAAD